ncbi:MAG: Bax inhibitor-1/YccA family protein [Deltaproteobacteria bacterium]|jgi:FtsH-binding integral membrane protein|nr:Bax inhibitor-1/YccA family protein [Deltaproteobacteria bacterium]
MQDFTQPPSFNAPRREEAPALAVSVEAAFFQKVYAWMCAAMAVTAFTGYLLSHSVAWIRFLTSTSIAWIAVLVFQVLLVLAINGLLNRVSSGVIKALFLAFAVALGFTISVVLLVYPTNVLVKAFVSTAGIYGGMAIFGMVTKRSLQAWGSFLMMGLMGLILASLVNIFAGSSAMDFVICVIGVLVFAGLTAYDHQKLRVMCASGFPDSETEAKAVTIGALELYLDFINLFLFLVRLFGRER